MCWLNRFTVWKRERRRLRVAIVDFRLNETTLRGSADDSIEIPV